MVKHFCIEYFLFFSTAPMRSSNAHMKSMASNSFYETSPENVVGSTKFENKQTNKTKQV